MTILVQHEFTTKLKSSDKQTIIMIEVPNPKIFLAGQIRQERRGNLGAVVCVRKVEERRGGVSIYTSLAGDLFSEEYLHLTGPFLLREDVRRIYAGISSEAYREMASALGDLNGHDGLGAIDKMLIYPNFVVDRVAQERRDLEKRLKDLGYLD
jgi:hypothetical protein